MKKISGILFDFNGTLFFDSRMHIEAFGKVEAMYSVPISSKEELIKSVFGKTNEQIFKEKMNSDATPEECELFSDRKKQLYFEACLANAGIFKLVDGVCEMLDYIKDNGIPYALVTGSDREEVEFFIKHLNIDRWFSFDKNIIYNDGTFNGKPAPDCYMLAAERISLPTSECAVFEDGRSGINAAMAAGCGAVIAMYESGIPSPVSDNMILDGEYHSFENWKAILSEFGL